MPHLRRHQRSERAGVASVGWAKARNAPRPRGGTIRKILAARFAHLLAGLLRRSAIRNNAHHRFAELIFAPRIAPPLRKRDMNPGKTNLGTLRRVSVMLVGAILGAAMDKLLDQRGVPVQPPVARVARIE